MREEFLQFLQRIKPTRKGVLALLLAIVLIPAMADVFFLYFFIGRHRESFFMTPFMMAHAVEYIPAFCIYLLVFFCYKLLV
jgi:hypothetical protein